MNETIGAPQTRAPLSAIEAHAGEAAALLKALANDQRLLVLCCLLDGPLSVGEINERVTLSQSALSQHLGVLREAGLVTTARKSQTVHYALAHGPALQIMEILYSAFCAPPVPKTRARKAEGKASRRIQPKTAKVIP
ncbi:MAG TPA: metalloregulator ArsR/SmtB family transcription factor [Steroidobacteraceae bacterium]|nr:metalloregulator ArsR/SmtB family transcription factor [Steroidobacteraceae bacterium]